MTDRRGSPFSTGDLPLTRPPPEPIDAPVGTGEVLDAHARLSFARVHNDQRAAENYWLSQVTDELDKDDPGRSWAQRTFGLSRFKNSSLPWDQSVFGETPLFRTDDVWAEVARRRAVNPNFLKQIPVGNQQQFSAWVLKGETDLHRQAQDVVRRQSGVTQGVVGFAADTGQVMLDPVNIATLPIGGAGRTIFGSMARQALVQGVTEAGQLPLIQSNLDVFGERMTAGEATQDVLTAAAGGAIIPGAIHVGGKLASTVGGAALRSDAGRAVSRALTPLAAQFAHLDRASDADVAALFKVKVPDGIHTPEQQAALHVVDRQAEIDAANPYHSTPAGMDAHADNLDDAMTATARGIDPAAAGVPPTRRRVSRETSPAVSQQIVGPAARPVVKRLIHHAETSPGHDYNAASGAMGPYQFLASTWVSLYKKRFSSVGRTDAQIAAMRRDPGLNETLMDDAMAEYGRALAKAGAPETPGNLYLMHFLGTEEGPRVLRADPDTPIADLVRRHGETGEPIVIKKNSFLRGKTAGEVIAWTRKRMGDPGHDVPALRPEAFDNDAEWRAAQAAMDAEVSAARRGAAGSAPDAMSEPIAAVPHERAPIDSALPHIDTDGNIVPAPTARVPAGEPFPEPLPAPVESGAVPRETSADVPQGDADAARQAAVAVADAVPRETSGDIPRATSTAWDGGAASRRVRLMGRAREVGGVEGSAKLFAIAAEHAPGMPLRDWLSDVLGTHKWTEAPKLTAAMKTAGHELALSAAEIKPLRDLWEAQNGWRDGYPTPTALSLAGERAVQGGDASLAAQAAKGFDDPHGPAAIAQVEGLAHDLKQQLDAGELADTPFATQGVVMAGGDSAPIYKTAAAILDELDAEDGALAALRGCM